MLLFKFSILLHFLGLLAPTCKNPFSFFFRADAAERGRKEVEHRVMSTEDAIESLQA